jgi:hypothetical protein
MTLGIIYTASLDTFAKVLTISTIIFMVGLSIWIIRQLRKSKVGKVFKFVYYFIVLLQFVILLVAFLYSPRNYILGNFDIAIDRPIGRITIQVKDILEIRPLQEDEMEGTVRTFGVGGLFGYFGSYHNQHIGDFKMYATRQTGLVIMHTAQGEAIVISPDDKDFVARIIAKRNDL